MSDKGDKGDAQTSSSGYQWPKWLVWCGGLVCVVLLVLCIVLPLTLTEEEEVYLIGSLAIKPFDPFTVNIWEKWGTSEKAREAFESLTEQQMIGQLQQFDWQRNQEGGLERNDYAAEIRKGNVGSLLNLQLPWENEWVQNNATAYWKTPVLFSNDTIHGHSTIFPVNIGMAAAFDRDLIYQGAVVAAKESKAYGIRQTFAPNLDITYDPRWGRVSEGCGEDPYLTGQLGVQFVRGFQENGVAACVKHVTGYGAARAGLDYAAADMDLAEMMNDYLMAMKPAILESWTLMASYNMIDGIPAHSNRLLFNDIIRGYWGWDGFIVADYVGVEDLQTLWQAEDERDAVRRALYAGVDMSMSDGYYLRYGSAVLNDIAPDGHAYRDYIRLSAQRINAVKDKVGLFDELNPPYIPEEICTAGNMAVAQRAVEESIVLLKNERVHLPNDDDPIVTSTPPLPITSGARVLLVGTLSESPRDMIGSWPARAFADDSCYDQVITYYDAICGDGRSGYAPDTAQGFQYDCTYLRGYSDPVFPHVFMTPEQNEELIDEVTAAIATGEYTHVLFMVGDKELQNGETTSRTDLTLSGYQGRLLRAARSEVEKMDTEERPNLIAVYLAARAMVMEWEVENMDAVVYGWVAGHMGGPGLKRVLFGAIDATGKLPFTVPRSVGQIPIYYHQSNSTMDPHGPGQIDVEYVGNILYSSTYVDSTACPRYVFGHGLHYNQYTYTSVTAEFGGVTVTPGESSQVLQIPRDTTEPIRVTVTVQKTGSIDSAEIVQLYVRDLVRTYSPSNKRLRGFERLNFIGPVVTQTYTFELHVNEDFGFYTPELEWIVEPGIFELMVAHNSHDESNKISVNVQ